MTVDELSEELFLAAATRAGGVGRHLGDGADADLRVMTQQAATVLVAVSDPIERHRQIADAHRDLLRLIDMAAAVAEALTQRGLYAPDLLGEQSYFPAKLRFCPCRHFC